MKTIITPLALLFALSRPVSSAPLANADGLDIGTGNTVPNGSKSVAIGDNNSVSSNSFAFGGGHIASEYSVTMGAINEAHYYSFAGGFGNFLYPTTYNSFAYGGYQEMYGSHATAIFGYFNAINRGPSYQSTNGYEQSSFIAGSSNEIQQGAGKQGYSNILLGDSNRISTYDGGDSMVFSSVLIGSNNSTSQTSAWAIGMGNIAQKETVTLGVCADPVANAALIVGRGNWQQRANGLVVLKDGTVSIPSGNLLLGTENVVTTAMLPGAVDTYLSGQPYLKKTTAATATLVPGAFAAWGESAKAQGLGSLAIGDVAEAQGKSGVALGYAAKSTTYAGTALGTYNRGLAGNATAWVDGDALLEVGNGTGEGTSRSNAITTQKNGRTTLTNKYWSSATPTAVPSPASPANASGGEALVVEGHAKLKGNTVLEGNVVIAQPQGDISMGIYQ